MCRGKGKVYSAALYTLNFQVGFVTAPVTVCNKKVVHLYSTFPMYEPLRYVICCNDSKHPKI